MPGSRVYARPRRASDVGGRSDRGSPTFSFAISRALGTVVVTLHGELEGDGGAALRPILMDLVEGQGNAVVVDMRDVKIVSREASEVFGAVAERARQHNSRFELFGQSLQGPMGRR